MPTVYFKIIYNLGGDADEDDTNYCFEPLKDYFEELPCV